MLVFGIINNVGIMINVDVNLKNWLLQGYVIKDFYDPSNCYCECDKSCDVGEYLDYENCKWRKRLIDKLVEEYSENIDVKELHSNKMIYNSTLNHCEKYVVLVQYT